MWIGSKAYLLSPWTRRRDFFHVEQLPFLRDRKDRPFLIYGGEVLHA